MTTATSELLDAVGTADWEVWTTNARLVVTRPDAIGAARDICSRVLTAVDRAASRFRTDSEVSRLAAATSSRATHTAPVSSVLAELLDAALRAAERTGGAVDPTIGNDLVGLGYVDAVPSGALVARAPGVTVRRRPRWRDVALERHGERATVTVPTGTLLDLGATAKAWAADACAQLVAERLECGALVSLGGDLRVAGAECPDGGWQVLVQDGPEEPATRIVLDGARAVATSSTLHRRWRAGHLALHHIVEPRTGQCAQPVWRTASVAAGDCVRANTLATAALVLGHGAVPLLRDAQVSSRLVAADGRIVTLGGWPR